MKAGATAFTPGDSRARVAGAKGGRQTKRRRLTLAYVEEQLGALQTPQDARRRLDRLGVWAAASLLPGVSAGAAVRAVECWLKALDAENGFDEIQKLRDAVAELRAERDRLTGELASRNGHR